MQIQPSAARNVRTATENGTYTPRPTQADILIRGLEIVQSVPYRVSARWLFYQLYQEGVYRDKNGYKKFKDLFAKARKHFVLGWRPDSLEDDTRSAILRGGAFDDEQDWLEAVAESHCSLDVWWDQDYYVEIMFEAKAMRQQFQHFTQNITLSPFGGDPSIRFKWDIAKRLERATEKYGHPIVILYFGDYDRKGIEILESAINDIRAWSGLSIELIRGGLNEGEATASVTASPRRPRSPASTSGKRSPTRRRKRSSARRSSRL